MSNSYSGMFSSIFTIDTVASGSLRLSASIQHVGTHVVPITVSSTILGVIAVTWNAATSIPGYVAHLKEFVTPGYLYNHLSLSQMLHLSSADLSLIAIAPIVDGFCRIGIGLSKIILISSLQMNRDNDPMDRRQQSMMDGLYEIFCGVVESGLGFHALGLASIPLTLLAFAWTNYLAAVSLLLSPSTRSYGCLKLLEATGFLLSGFGMPIGGVLLAVSAGIKLFAPPALPISIFHRDNKGNEGEEKKDSTAPVREKFEKICAIHSR